MATTYTINAGDVSSNLGIGNNMDAGVYEIASNLNIQTSDLAASSPEILSISYSRMESSGPLTVTVVSTDETLGGVAKTEYSLNNTVDWVEFDSVEGADNKFTGTFQLEGFSLPLGFYIRVTDVDGNQTVSDNYVISGLTVSASAYYWTASDVTISVLGASTIAQMKYSLDNGKNWTELTLSPPAGGSRTGSFLLTKNADIIFRVTDNDGNVFTHNPYPYIWIDKDAPEVSTSGGDQWTNEPVTITVNVNDYSGVDKAYYTFNGTAWEEFAISSVPGAYTGSFTIDSFGPFAVKVVDKAGNVTITPARNVRIDKVDPLIDSLTGWETWTNDSQTISVVSSDPEIYIGDDPNKPAPGSGIATIEYSFNGEWWKPIEITYAEGKYVGNFTLNDFGPFAVRVTDQAGNSVVESHNARIDRIDPVVESVTWDKTWTNGSVTVSATFSDVLSGVDKTYWTSNGSPWEEFTGSFALDHNGPFQVKVVDKAGNETLSANYNIWNIDLIDPTVDSINWDREWTNAPVEVTVEASDDYSGVALVEYSLDGGSSWTVYEEPFEMAENGPIQVRVTDNAGNFTIGEDEVGNIDMIAPTVDSFAWDTEWTKDPVSVTVTASDDLSGVALTEYSLDGGETWTAFEDSFEMAENGVFKVRATDNAGNVSLEEEGEMTNIDVTAPAIADPVYDTAWTNQTITVSVTADDFGQSGVVAMLYTFKGSPWTQFADGAEGSFSVSGNGMFAIKAVDAVGNESTSQNYSITNYDSLAPTIDSIDYSGEWTNGNVTVNVSASDDYSGVAKTYFTFNGTPWTEFEDSFELTANGPFMVKVVDNAGNETISDADPEKEKAQPYNIKTIDRLAPVIDTVDYSNEWTNGNVTVSVTAHDEADAENKASGVAAMYYTFAGSWWAEFDGSFELTANGPFQVKVVDNAGNEKLSKVYNIKSIDRLAPTVDSVTWDKEWTNQPITVTVAVSDLADAENKASGIAKTEYTFASSDWIEFDGSFEVEHNGSLQIRVTDNAGNVTLSGNYNIRNYDSLGPTIDSIDYSSEWTNGNVTVNVSASDDYSGVAKTYFTFNGTPWTEFEDSFELTANGPFMVKVVDNAGNETISDSDPEKEKPQPYNIKTIDRLAPVIDTIDYSNEWTNGNVMVSVTAHDEADAENKASGVAAMYYTFNGSWWAEFDGSFELSANGPFMVKVVDNAGNETTSQHYNIKTIDRLAPTVDSVTWDKAWTNQPIEVTVAVSDLADAANKASGIAKTEYTFRSSGWTEFTDSFTVEHNGSLQIRVTDNAGNVTLSGNYNIRNYDSLPPVIGDVSWDQAWTKDPVTVSVTTSDDYSGIATTEYSFDGGVNWTAFTDTFDVIENGTFQVKVTDNAGNVTTSGDYEVTNIDKVVPVIDSVSWNEGWTNEDVTVTVSASDALSGVATTEYSFDGGVNWTAFTDTFDVIENGTFQVKVTDNAGNVTTSGDYEVTNIDKVVPVIDSVSWNEGWTNEDVTVTVSASDALSGVATTEYSFDGGVNWTAFTDTFDVIENGTFQVKVTDNAGNVTTSGDYEVTNIDKVDPTIDSVTWNTAWTKNPVTVSVSASDNLSGIASTEYSFKGAAWTAFTNAFTVTENGTFQVRATDNAGNVTVSDIYEVTNIDTDGPTIDSVTRTPMDWTNAYVTVTVTASAPSGVKSTEYTLNGGISWTGFTNTFAVTDNGTFKIRVRDNAGNEKVSDAYEVANIDKINPSIDSVTWDTKWTTSPVTVNVNSSDPKDAMNIASGIATTEYSFKGGVWTAFTNAFPVTENGTFNVRATDNAGNVTVSATYEVTNIDPDGPTIDSVSWNTSWTNQDVTVTVTASSSSGVKSTEYSLNGGGSWTAFTNTFDMTENGTFTIRVKDNAGGETVSGGYDVTNIDKVNPSINSVSWDHEWTKDPVTVSVYAIDTLSGIASTEYSFKGGVWTAFTSAFTVTENGTFQVRATDKAGNVTVSDTYEVTNIDTDGPTIDSVTLDPTTWTNDKVTVTVEASAPSGVKSMEYSFNAGSWTDFADTFAVTENDTFKIRVKDNVGHEVVSVTYSVANIDKIPPVINSVSQSTYIWTNTDVTLTIDATDAGGSGVAVYEYLDGETWTALAGNTYVATAYGDYKFRVLDGAGNVSSAYTQAVENIDKVDPVISYIGLDESWTGPGYQAKIDAEDALSGVASIQYSLNGEAWKEYSGPFKLTSNGTLSVKVSDKAGNEAEGSHVFSGLDFDGPTISSVNWTPKEPTTGFVTVTVSAEDAQSGVSGLFYSMVDSLIWTQFSSKSSGQFVLTSNCTFVVKAVDGKGNETVSDPYIVDNIIKNQSNSAALTGEELESWSDASMLLGSAIGDAVPVSLGDESAAGSLIGELQSWISSAAEYCAADADLKKFGDSSVLSGLLAV